MIYLVAVTLRLWVRQAPIYGDEGFHFFVSQHGWGDVPHIHPFDTSYVGSTAHLFWWRPAFMALLSPGALLSFDHYRILFILYVSLLPVLAYLILRQVGVRLALSLGVALAVALHPFYVVWGVRVFPDALMSVAFAGGLLLWLRNNAAGAAVAFLLSVWVKESAIVGVGVVFTLQAWRDLRAASVRTWSWRAHDMLIALGAIVVVALVPLAFALRLGLNFPGWGTGGDWSATMDRLFFSAWLVPLVLVGLAWPRTRPLAYLALTYPAFYLARLAYAGKGIEIWYLALPAFLTLLCIGVVLDEVLVRSRRSHPRLAPVPWAAVAVVGMLLLATIVLPMGRFGKDHIMPLAQVSDDNLPNTMRQELRRDRELPELLEQMEPDDWESLFLVDVGWFFIFHPFGTEAKALRFGYTGHPTSLDDLGGWVRVAEEMTNSTVLLKHPSVVNAAFQATYADCRVYENGVYVLYRMAGCDGRLERFREEVANATSSA